MTHERHRTIVIAMAALSAVAASGSPLRADQAGDYRKLVDAKRSAYVSVKFVLKLQMAGQSQEAENEINGVMIDPEGLVLCSNTQISGFTNLLSQFGMGGVSAKPRDIKVLIGDDTEGIDASFVARDTELDLAWVRIKEPGEKKYDHVDLSKSAQAETGDAVLTLRRMGKYFDRAVVLGDGRIGGVTVKPRRLYVPASDFTSSLGLPAFTPAGDVIGVTILQMPDPEDSDGGNFTSLLAMRMGIQDMMSGMILPAEEVAKATDRARKLTPEDDEGDEDEDADEGDDEKEEASDDAEETSTDKVETP